MQLMGRVAVVTGAGRGIGREIALELARRGADVVVADLDVASAKGVAGEIAALGRRSLPMPVDVAMRSQVDELVERTAQEMGRLDIFVNNAGIVHVKPFLEITEEEWDRVFAVNVKGVLFGTQAAAREMIKQRSGRIINLASIAGKLGRPMLAAYAASKAAVISITRSAALVLAPYGITVNAICPGVVDTQMWEKIDAEMGAYEGKAKGEVMRGRIAEIPLGRVEKPEDVARVAAFLASDDSAYMTGQAINVCGGIVMH